MRRTAGNGPLLHSVDEPVDQALHNIRSNPSASDPSIAKIASGQMYIASEVVKKEDEEWIRLHPQTLHTYRLPDKPCWIAVYIKNETHFLKRVESVQA